MAADPPGFAAIIGQQTTMRSVSCKETALLAINRHIASGNMAHYGANLTMHALVNLAQITNSNEIKKNCLQILKPFYSGKIEKVSGIFDKIYRTGGNASALLVKYGYAANILDYLVSKADELINNHPRHSSGAFGSTEAVPGSSDKVWIDTVFAVCPFLAILGNLTGRYDLKNESIRQYLEHHKLLFNPDTGLYHQGINFTVPGKVSEDHWSRGNGWAALALAELVTELPENTRLTGILKKFITACVKFQDDKGLWHQEMTMHDSFTETSGTGLILYALGRGLELNILPQSFKNNFLKGLKGYLTYISLDGSIFNACEGCRCPGNGTIKDYLAKQWRLNDDHSFGPAALAFTQALRLGIDKINID